MAILQPIYMRVSEIDHLALGLHQIRVVTTPTASGNLHDVRFGRMAGRGAKKE
jgi:hypothetical protein